MRLFAKLLLLLGVCAGLPLAFLGAAALWRSHAIGQALIDSNAAVGRQAADAGQRALFDESRRLHRDVVERRAAELADFFEQGRRLVVTQTELALRFLEETPPPDGPALWSDAEAQARLRGSQAADIGRAPYAVYRLAPGVSLEKARTDLQRLARLGDYYPTALRESPWLKSVYLGAEEGFLLGYPGRAPFPAGYDPRRGDWYKKALKKGRITWTTIYFDKDGRPVITCAEPIVLGGKVFGVSAADISLDKLIDRLFDLREVPVEEAALVNVFGGVRLAASDKQNGKFQWRAWSPDDAPTVRSYHEGRLAPAFAAALKTPSGTVVAGDDLLSYARVRIMTREGGKDWYYLARTPVAAVIGPALEARHTLERLNGGLGAAIASQTQALSSQLLIAAALALLAALLGAWLGAGVVSRPLAELAAVARRVGHGDLEARASAGGADEVGDLSRAVNEMIAGLKEGVFVKSTFKRYLSASVVDQILKDPAALRLGGEEREMTVFFSDMSGFTELSERLEPRRLVELINEYLSAMTDSIFLQEGTLDKYEGDAVMAFWGAPLPQEDHARRACWAALDNRSRLKDLCASWETRGLPTFDIRIGINTGRMIVGNVGSAARMEYTVLGDAVNSGSRLEQANKLYGTHILVSEATRQGAGGAVEAREIDLLAPRGKTTALRVFELLGLPGQIPEARLRGYRTYEAGLSAFRQRRWDDAEAAFREALAILGEDKASSVLLQRVLVFRHHPPQEDWDGVFRLGTAAA